MVFRLGIGFQLPPLTQLKRSPRSSLKDEAFRISGLGGADFDRSGSVQTRTHFFYGLTAVVFVILTGRLFSLQIVRGSYYRQVAESNRVRLEKIAYRRGIIFDRHGQPLVRNVPVEESGEKLKREYIYSEAFAHVLGFVGQADEQALKENEQCPDCKQILLGDIIGRSGLEQTFDEILRGVNGAHIVETDTSGNIVGEHGRIEPQVGEGVITTLDLGLQRTAFEAIDGRTGAIVATKPDSGEVLVLLSLPAFDPNFFADGSHRVDQILSDQARPQLNRVIGGAYPPGSTFKVVTAAAGLEEGKIDSQTEIEDVGVLRVGAFEFGNWYYRQYGRTEGVMTLVPAIKRSNDIYFYKVGELVGPESLSLWAAKFHLGEKTGIDLQGESPGLLPSPDWKEKTKGEPWFLGNTYHFAIGQGDLTTTPLQINQMTAVIASGGSWCRPRLNPKSEIPRPRQDEAAGGRNPKLEQESSLDQCEDLGLKKEIVELIKEGMVETCRPKGTAYPFFEFEPQVACKTGTAEYIDPDDGEEKTHAWFTVFAPAEKPEIVLTVLLEGAGEGSSEAAPVAKEILQYYFHRPEE